MLGFASSEIKLSLVYSFNIINLKKKKKKKEKGAEIKYCPGNNKDTKRMGKFISAV